MTNRTEPVLINYINARLNELNWSQNELARHAKVSKASISDVMNGRRPGIEVCKAIANALDVPEKTILVLSGHIEDHDHSEELDELAELFAQLSEDDQDEIIKLARIKLKKSKPEKK